MDITFEKLKRIVQKLRFEFPYDLKDWMRDLNMENYHKHSDFSNNSVMDSAESMENYAVRIKDLKGQCIYSGEHGNQGNAYKVYALAEKNGLRYRHSTEAYWVKDRHEKDRTNCHIVLVAKNDEGRQDINYILSVANEDGHYAQPRIDLELLLQVPKENLIVTSACIAGWKYPDAEEIWLKIARHFGDNFFCELQSHDTEKQKELNRRILQFAKRYDLQLIAGLDSHYVLEENRLKRLNMMKRKEVAEEDDEQGWYMDYPDTKTLISRFEKQGVLTEEEILLAILNTNVFVNNCEEIVFDRRFKIPNIHPDLTYAQRCTLYKRSLNSAYKKETFRSKEKADAIRWEAQQYIDSGTVDYPIISEAFVKLAQEKYGGVLTFTSRGSSSSFVTNKLSGLTTIDRFTAEVPIYPERFLTKERVLSGSMPDIDLNVASQEPFVQALRELLGPHGVYPLMKRDLLKEKAAWLLYAGVNDVEPSQAAEISKALSRYNDDVQYAEEGEAELIKVEDYLPSKYLELYKQSIPYQGIMEKCGVHACGHLIFNGDIRREIGLISCKNKTTKERTLVAAIEGNDLDAFGYVKEDLLIVDVVSLTDELYQHLGRKTPSVNELREMVKDDPLTWGIYEKGITCCVNQCEGKKTRQKVMKYKPKNPAELSSFVAGVRPGFASLIGQFISREPYSTGEQAIDSLLEDTAHYMIFQESIMKVLQYLGLPMDETYGVIKAISKKKYLKHPEEKEKLLSRLKKGWMERFGNLDNFGKIWKVIEDSAAYAFNAPHALSMCFDSLAVAWVKAHHPDVFYTVAINHYQQKKGGGDKNKIEALTQEAIRSYGYTLGSYKFGADNRYVHIEDDILYPSLSSIKGFSQRIADSLWHVWQEHQAKMHNFLDVLIFLSEQTVINMTQVSNLILVGYFSKYGSDGKLLDFLELFKELYGTKVISAKKAEKLHLDLDELAQFGKRTEKTVRNIDSVTLLRYFLGNLPERELPIRMKLQAEQNVLGVLHTKNRNADKNLFFTAEIELKPKIVYASLYEIQNGTLWEVKFWRSELERQDILVGDLVYVGKLEQKVKRRPPTIEEEEKFKSSKWIPEPGSYETWVKGIRVIENP